MVLAPALSALGAELSLAGSTVEAVSRADVVEAGCDGLEGDALLLPLAVSFGDEGGTLIAEGSASLIAVSGHDPALQRVETRLGLDLSTAPSDVSAAVGAYEDEHDLTRTSLSVDLEGPLSAPEVSITLRSEAHVATVAMGTLSAD